MVWNAVDAAEVDQDAGGDSTAAKPEPPAGQHSPVGYGHTPHAGDQTRARIIDVAVELIADRGFAATSTREIAERLGLTKAALYYHFRTKDDLLLAILDPAMAGVDALIERHQGAQTPQERRDMVEEYVDLVAAHAELIRVLASDPSVKDSPGLKAALPRFRRMIPLLAGTDDPDTAQRTRVRAALTAVHGALVQAQPDDDPVVVRATALAAACAVLGLPAPAPGDHSERVVGIAQGGDAR